MNDDTVRRQSRRETERRSARTCSRREISQICRNYSANLCRGRRPRQPEENATEINGYSRYIIYDNFVGRGLAPAVKYKNFVKTKRISLLSSRKCYFKSKYGIVFGVNMFYNPFSYILCQNSITVFKIFILNCYNCYVIINLYNYICSKG